MKKLIEQLSRYTPAPEGENIEELQWRWWVNT
jgi:hypothetical protein